MRSMDLSHPLQLTSHPVDGRILEVLAGADASFTGRQVHALLGAYSARGVQLGLDRLRRQGIITAEPAGKAILYRFNITHLAADHILALVHLRRELLRRLRMAFESWNPKPVAAYLFGSTARNESTADSDVDLCIIRPRGIQDSDQANWREQVDRVSRDINGWTGNEARVLEYGEDQARSLIDRDQVLAAVLAEGIRLVGDEGFLHGRTRRRR